jgi:pre-mRNA-splicing factor ATP-dependent RNA helicase DHX16
MSKRPATQSVEDIRIQSRQQYLGKRNELKLAELRRQVADEAEEERRANEQGKPLSKRELQDFRRNAETLRLALSREAIDDGLGGYVLPDAQLSQRKEEVLNKRIKEYKTEHDLWEDEQSAKAKATGGHKQGKEQEEDYEFVFDTTQSIQFVNDGKWKDPQKQMLEAKLEAAEKRASSIEEVRRSLPMYQYRQEILDAIDKHHILVLTGETGSGKSTQLPQYVLESGYLKTLQAKSPSDACQGGMIGVTQPRRVAASSLATRVAEERGCKLGTEVGYTVRFEDKTGPDTKIKFMTDGLLLREIMTDPMLSNYSFIMLDEAHERVCNTDLLITLLRGVAQHRQDDFRLLISSATLDAQKFSAYLGDAPIMNIPGRTFAVENLFLSTPEASYLSAAITTIWQIHLSEPVHGGDILCFLTGEEEIESCETSLTETARKLGSKAPELIVRKLYSSLDQDEQKLVFEPTPKSARKVVLATNIAETSLTVDGVRYVIDSGYSKEMTFNASTGMSSLQVTPISRASVNQRAGRAGRVSDGKCFHLYTRWSYWHELEENTTPEILRCDLTPVCLQLKALGINNLLEFEFMDAPPIETFSKSLELLYTTGAINSTSELTKLGRRMAELPLDPLLSASILAADKYGCVSEVLTIVAMLQESATLFLRPKDKKVHADAARARFQSATGGDFLTLLNVYNAWVEADYDPLWSRENFIQQRAINRARDVRDQLEKLCDRVEVAISTSPNDDVAIRKAITHGHFTHSARLARDGQSYLLKSGISAHIHPSSSCYPPDRRPKTLVYSELINSSREFMRNVMPIDPAWLSECAPHYFSKKELEEMGTNRKMPKEKSKTGTGYNMPTTGARVKA